MGYHAQMYSASKSLGAFVCWLMRENSWVEKGTFAENVNILTCDTADESYCTLGHYYIVQWSLLLWRYSKPTRMSSCATHSR